VYTKPFWGDDRWYQARVHSLITFCHVNVQDPRYVWYFENAVKGEKDIATQTTPGKFLKKYFGDVLTENHIKTVVDRHRAAFLAGAKLRYAKTPDEMEEVYTMQASFQSCMQRKGSTFSYCEGVHPVRAYGAGDLELAYISEGERLLARCLIWREKGLVGRIYGDVALMQAALRGEGIETTSDSRVYDSFLGARLLRMIPQGIPSSRKNTYWSSASAPPVILPYIDGKYTYIEDLGNDLLKITDNSNSAKYNASHQEGVMIGRPYCACCNRLRDSSMYVVTALAPDDTPESEMAMENLGYTEEARASRQWTLREYCSSCADDNAFYDTVSGFYFANTVEVIEFGTTTGRNTIKRPRGLVEEGTYFRSDLSGVHWLNEHKTEFNGQTCANSEVAAIARKCAHDGRMYLKEEMRRVNFQWVYHNNVEAYQASISVPEIPNTLSDLFGSVHSKHWVERIIERNLRPSYDWGAASAVSPAYYQVSTY
jgi:hypothetical protein